jgi:hypothetical protein
LTETALAPTMTGVGGNVQVDCPCCGTKLVVDAATGTILSEERPKADPGASFEQAMTEVKSGAARREDAFSKAFQRTKNLDELLQKKFEEAKKKAANEPGGKPRNPLDFD